MAEIGSVVLTSHHVAKGEFSYNGNPLPSELTVTMGFQQLTFCCERQGSKYCIHGTESIRFAQQNSGKAIALYAKEKMLDKNKFGRSDSIWRNVGRRSPKIQQQ
ncbi:hypothetical protein PVK06_013191 [Gossypium arboreum]|uniref:Uncharacterized protein n=1 Tax=Gossypium arboreum TaxID=29729 RepID=A0ABR0QEA5_GOSAR|nr:hypothetical protein PVK06_013191 [Gossypium arboreum]